MNFSLIYLTARIDPRFQWFVDSLCNQCADGQFPQVIFIDSCLWGENYKERVAALQAIVAGRFSYQHHPPKPCVWQGPHRLTQRDYFAAANARNTGLCYAKEEYIFYVDDLTVLMPGWVDNARHAAKSRYVAAGSYKKAWDMVVEGGLLVSCRETAGGTDSRWHLGSNTGADVKIDGGKLFGCSFGLPVSTLLDCNGQDEMCDSLGGEDYFLGLSLEKLGVNIFYNRNLSTRESEEGHGQGPIYLRLDKGLGKSSLDLLARRRASGPRAMGNDFNLAELRQKILSGEPFPVPTKPDKHFWDGQPLSEL